jgi:CBS domain containing-hemolysin-like protein
VPLEGESLEFAGYRFTAERVEGRRVSAVRVAPVPGWQPSDGEPVAG